MYEIRTVTIPITPGVVFQKDFAVGKIQGNEILIPLISFDEEPSPEFLQSFARLYEFEPVQDRFDTMRQRKWRRTH